MSERIEGHRRIEVRGYAGPMQADELLCTHETRDALARALAYRLLHLDDRAWIFKDWVAEFRAALDSDEVLGPVEP